MKTSRCAFSVGWTIGLVAGLLLLPAALLVDRTLMRALHPDAFPRVVVVLQHATWLGYGLVDIAIPLAIGAFAWGRSDRERGKSGAWGGAAVAAAGIVDQILKNALCRARPSAADAGAFFKEFPCVPAPYALASFPSGHATTAFALAAVLALWYPRWTVVWLAFAAIVGWSRIALGAHFPSDVVAGGILGIAVVLAFVRWVPGASAFKHSD